MEYTRGKNRRLINSRESEKINGFVDMRDEPNAGALNKAVKLELELPITQSLFMRFVLGQNRFINQME